MKNQKLLLALQFWDRDKDQAMRVARLIADLQSGFSEQADFLFVARFDSSQDMKTVEYVSRKFNVQHYINSRYRGAEWPHGCNSLWFGTMDYIYSYRQAGRIPDYKAVLTFEADSCPLHPAWISTLSQEWDRLDRKMVGHLLGHGPDGKGHINGNCLVSCDMSYLKWISREVGGCSPQGGWDYLLAPQFRARGWADSPAIRSWYRQPTLSAEQYEIAVGQGCALLHGVKDDSVMDLVRKRFIA